MVHGKSVTLRILLFCLATFLLLSLTIAWAGAQGKIPPANAAVTADQQKQLDQLKELGDQLQRDRDAVHAAITSHGLDSDEADAAQQRLFQDRQEYRNVRRSLRVAGVAIPAEAAGPGMGGAGMANCPNSGCQHGPHGCCGSSQHCPAHQGHCCQRAASAK